MNKVESKLVCVMHMYVDRYKKSRYIKTKIPITRYSTVQGSLPTCAHVCKQTLLYTPLINGKSDHISKFNL